MALSVSPAMLKIGIIVFSTLASTSRAPTLRAIASASAHSGADSPIRPHSMSTWASAANTCARSAEGGETGISSTARRYSGRASSPRPAVHR